MLYKRGKKAQVTLFVIIAIVIVAVFLILYFTVFSKPKITPESQVSEVKAYVSDSIQSKVLEDIITVASQGGYALPPENSFPTPFYEVAYWVDNNEIFYPSKEELASNIDFLNYFIGKMDLNQLFSGYDITQGDFESNTTVLNDSVAVSITWPITIKKGSVTQRLENFDFNYNIRLGKLYNAAVQAADDLALDRMPSDLPEDMNLSYYLYDNAALYEIKDVNDDYKLDNESYSIAFAIR